MRKPEVVIYALVVLLAASCGASGPDKAATADAIYYGGLILTMNDTQRDAEEVAIKDGKIFAVGDRAQIEKLHKGQRTQMVDLAGKTMLPGFFDAHSHFSQVGLQAISANLLPPPDGPVKTIEQLQATLRDHLRNSTAVTKYGLVMGFDYDDSQLAEKRSPNRQELDEVTTELPVLIIHQSGHLGVYNSKALSIAGITAETPNPQGGVIERESDGKSPSGVLEENAHFTALLKLLPKFTPEQGMELIEAAQDIYLANGFRPHRKAGLTPPLFVYYRWRRMRESSSSMS